MGCCLRTVCLDGSVKIVDLSTHFILRDILHCVFDLELNNTSTGDAVLLLLLSSCGLRWKTSIIEVGLPFAAEQVVEMMAEWS